MMFNKTTKIFLKGEVIRQASGSFYCGDTKWKKIDHLF